MITEAGQEITEEIAKKIEDSPIEQLRRRLACESKKAYAKYGRVIFQQIIVAER